MTSIHCKIPLPNYSYDCKKCWRIRAFIWFVNFSIWEYARKNEPPPAFPRNLYWYSNIITKLSHYNCVLHFYTTSSDGIYFFKVNNGNIRTMCVICSKLTIKIPERHYWIRSGVFIVKSKWFHRLFRYFQCWLLTSKRMLGYKIKGDKVFKNGPSKFFKGPLLNTLSQRYLQ